MDEAPEEREDIQTEEVRSEKARKTSLSASDVKLDDLVRGNSRFAFDLYAALREEGGNLFYSPHSISVALAMMYAGANERTARQMEEVLRFQLAPDQLHPAFNVLDLELSSRGERSSGQDGDGFQLNIANAIWGQKEYTFLPRFPRHTWPRTTAPGCALWISSKTRKRRESQSTTGSPNAPETGSAT